MRLCNTARVLQSSLSIISLFFLAAGGCGGDSGDADAHCELLRYGDGTCDPDLPCEAPDIDCFALFDDDRGAAEWYMPIEAGLAAELGGEPRRILPPDDPRHERLRELLDRGWEAYKATNAVGDLGGWRPGLVVVEDAEPNASAVIDRDTMLTGFIVVVHSALVDGADVDLLGIILHELEHAVGLHHHSGVEQGLRTYYLEDGALFGFEQIGDPVARAHAESWLELGELAGGYSDADLRGLPLGGAAGELFDILMSGRADTPACAEAAQAFLELAGALTSGLFEVGGELDLPPDAGVQVDAAMERLRSDCLAEITQSLIEVLAEVTETTPEQVRDALEPSHVALIDNRHALDGLAAVIIHDRSEMRAVEEEFTAATGAAWTQLRYYSTEEAADDATIPVLEAAELPATGLADGLLWLVGEALGPQWAAGCTAVIAAGETPGYGADLTDDHHDPCWRVDHIGKLAASGRLAERVSSSSSERRRSYRRTAAPRRGLPLPPRYRDWILH